MTEPIAAKKPQEVKPWDDRVSGANGSPPPASVSGANGLNGIPFVLFAEMDIHFHSLCRKRLSPSRAKRPVVGGAGDGGWSLHGGVNRSKRPVCEGFRPCLGGAKRAHNGPFRVFCEPAWRLVGERGGYL